MILGPLIVVALHRACVNGSCKLAMPVFSKKFADYFNKQALLFTLAFGSVTTLLSFIFGKIRLFQVKD